MAAEQEANQEGEAEEEAPRRGPGTVVWLLLLVISASCGFAIPFVMSDAAPPDEDQNASSPSFEMPSSDETIAVPFGEVTVNLDEGRMNRYLRLKIAVLVAKEEETMVLESITARTPLLKNWLLSHLSDKDLDEIRGKAGLNMLRREIRREFNEALFDDRRDHIYDILFEEFNIQ